MESAVFAYFVSIGAGLAFGLTVGAVPAVLIYRYFKRKEEGGYGRIKQATKTTSRQG